MTHPTFEGGQWNRSATHLSDIPEAFQRESFGAIKPLSPQVDSPLLAWKKWEDRDIDIEADMICVI